MRLPGNGIGWSIEGLAAASFEAVSAAGNANRGWTGGALGLPPAVPTLEARWALGPAAGVMISTRLSNTAGVADTLPGALRWGPCQGGGAWS